MSKTHDLALIIPVAEVSAETRTYHVVASQSQLSKLVERFKIVSLDSLSASVGVSASDKHDGFTISGHINAALEQQCIVSLKPVAEVIDEDFELMLVSPETADKFDEDEMYLDPDAPDYDALESDKIDIGEIIAQTVSVMMNPYPRHEDAKLEDVANKVVSVNQDLEKKPNPFSVLSKLSDES